MTILFVFIRNDKSIALCGCVLASVDLLDHRGEGDPPLRESLRQAGLGEGVAGSVDSASVGHLVHLLQMTSSSPLT